jgi:hypothetical protein
MVKKYVETLESDLLSLQENVAGLEAHLLAANNRIKILEKERKPPPVPTDRDQLDTARRIAFILARAGMKITDGEGKPVRAKRTPPNLKAKT